MMVAVKESVIVLGFREIPGQNRERDGGTASEDVKYLLSNAGYELAVV